VWLNRCLKIKLRQSWEINYYALEPRLELIIVLRCAESRGRISSPRWVNVEEECDEALYWMEMLIESGSVRPKLLKALMDEGSEILAIIVASIKTARRNK
jgi:hypothetical protein